MDSTVLRRVSAIIGHLDSPEANSTPLITSSSTAGEFVLDKRFSVVLPEKLSAGNWNVYRSALSPLNLMSRFPKHPEICTLHDTFEHTVRNFSDCNYLGTRTPTKGMIDEYKWMTYGEAGMARAAVGSGLIRQGVPRDSSIGLYFINRPEWVLVDHACSAYSYVSVPLYDTLGPDSAKYIINHASLKAIFCLQQTLNSLLSILPEIPSVQLIVVVDGIENHISLLPLVSGLAVISYSKLLDQGYAQIQQFRPPRSENIATICYTSGTTGTPKGAVLSHGNLVASAAGASLAIKFCSHDVYISYLPLAHIYERVNLIMATYYGAAVGFYQGDNLKLLDDMVLLRPTIFCSVPRLYNRIYSSITSAVKTSGALREKIFNAAYNAKKRAMLNGKTASPIWDRLVFNKIKQKLGGRIRLMGSGASPLSADVMDFLRIVFGCEVIEGYGMTETSCCISTMIEGDCMAGHVGAPTGACEVKLVDVPEMNYSSEDRPYPRGEICARGPIVFQGYYKDEMQTKEILDEDGWLHTGDIGLWLPGGRLRIIDRKKNIFKLAQGEYIAPEKIENAYTKCRFVSQCFVYGDSLKSSLVAVVSVNQEEMKAWAAAQSIEYERLEGLCMDRRTRNAVLADMNNVGRLAQLRGFEMVKAVRLVAEPFTFENGLLTPTFKIKRAQAKSYFSEEISAMYAELGSCSDTDPPSLIM